MIQETLNAKETELYKSFLKHHPKLEEEKVIAGHTKNGRFRITYGENSIIYSKKYKISQNTIDPAIEKENIARKNEIIYDNLNRRLSQRDFLDQLKDGAFLDRITMDKIQENTGIRIYFSGIFQEDSPVVGYSEKRRKDSLYFTKMISENEICSFLKNREFAAELSPEMKEKFWNVRDEKIEEYREKFQKTGICKERDWVLQDTFVPKERNVIRKFARNEPFGRESVSVQDHTVFIQSDIFSFRYLNGNLKMESESFLRNLLKKSKDFMKRCEKYKEWRREVSLIFQKQNLVPKCKLIHFSDGEKPMIQIEYMLDTQKITEQYPLRAMKTGIQSIQKKMNQAKKQKEKEEADQRRRIINELSRKPYYGEELTASILDLIERNQKHITGNTVIEILRGLSIRSTWTYDYGKCRGLYSILRTETVETVIDQLVKDRILQEYGVRGTYGTYYLLKPGLPLQWKILKEKTPLHFGKDKKYQEYTDFDWVAFMKERNPEILSLKEWNGILPVLDHTGVFCVNQELCLDFFRKAPEPIKEYIKMSASMEEGEKKKVLMLLKKDWKKK